MVSRKTRGPTKRRRPRRNPRPVGFRRPGEGIGDIRYVIASKRTGEITDRTTFPSRRMAERYAGKDEEVVEVRSSGAVGPFQEGIEHTPRRNPILSSSGPRLERSDLEKWRKPDVNLGGRDTTYGIWYGPDGPEGETATEVEIGVYIDYTEYQYLGGYVDELIPGEEFLRTTYSFDEEDLLAALKRVGIGRPRSSLDLLRYAAAYGSQMMAYWGGTEEYESELPR